MSNLTLAQLKRDAKAGNKYAEMIYRFGKPLPERLQGRRLMVDANSVAIFFLNKNGEKSELRIRSSLIEYTGDSLSVYAPGYREMTAEEKAVMKEWEKITASEDFRKQSDIDALTDGSCTYWQRKRFFKERNMEHLLGGERVKGMVLSLSRYGKNEPECILDEKVKGDLEIEYKFFEHA